MVSIALIEFLLSPFIKLRYRNCINYSFSERRKALFVILIGLNLLLALILCFIATFR
jgi:hypothetical protein